MKKGIIIVSIFLIALLSFFYFLPRGEINFVQKTSETNFNLVNESEMQFYPNMRFASSDISYSISDCTLKKTNDMQYAFSIISNLTPLRFYPTDSNEDIFITCDEGLKQSDSGLFIAGEGGPTTIVSAGNFNIITKGKILLIKKSDCATPNVALHELLHVLGFIHSDNLNNVMYNITDCSQVIGDDVVSLLNYLYSIPSYSDLTFENVTAKQSGNFLDIEFSVMNYGFKDSKSFFVNISSDDSLLKEINVEQIEFGKGRIISIKNIFTIKKISELELSINADFDEIDRENNKIKLEIQE